MSQPVVHFEIIGKQAENLRKFYSDLFAWEYDTNAPVAPEISDEGSYGFTQSTIAGDGMGIPGGIGGGDSFTAHTMVYVGVPNVEQALQNAERLGATRVLGPVANKQGKIIIGHFRDPEGNLIGVAGAESPAA